MGNINVLAIGDIVGEPGREACRLFVPVLRREEGIDFVFANGENVAGGSGVTAQTAEELFASGIDVITSGDHIFKRRETLELLAREPRLLRPANFPPDTVGNGSFVWTDRARGVSIGVVNIVGRVFLAMADCPFRRIREEVDSIKAKTPIILVDFHAEATSEKIAMGWFLDGDISALVGTHTHVQTADECILPKGSAYITDLGMTGPFRSVLGRDIEPVLTRFVKQVPTRFEVATGDVRLSGVVIKIDDKTGKALSIKRVHKKVENK